MTFPVRPNPGEVHHGGPLRGTEESGSRTRPEARARAFLAMGDRSMRSKPRPRSAAESETPYPPTCPLARHQVRIEPATSRGAQKRLAAAPSSHAPSSAMHEPYQNCAAGSRLRLPATDVTSRGHFTISAIPSRFRCFSRVYRALEDCSEATSSAPWPLSGQRKRFRISNAPHTQACPGFANPSFGR